MYWDTNYLFVEIRGVVANGLQKKLYTCRIFHI